MNKRLIIILLVLFVFALIIAAGAGNRRNRVGKDTLQDTSVDQDSSVEQDPSAEAAVSSQSIQSSERLEPSSETHLSAEPPIDDGKRYKNLSSSPNAFVLSSIRASAGETFETPLQLRGVIDLCAFDIRVHYDISLLRFAGSDHEDDSLLLNCDATNGILYINFLRVQNLTEECTLCDLAFQVMTSQSVETTLRIEVEDVVGVGEDGEILRRDCTLENAVIYLNRQNSGSSSGGSTGEVAETGNDRGAA